VKEQEIIARNLAFGVLSATLSLSPGSAAAFAAYAALCKDHFWKESDIRYPAAERMLSKEDAAEIVQGIEDFEESIEEGTRERYDRMA
jgi:hemerythrin-like domain-containing protein